MSKHGRSSCRGVGVFSVGAAVLAFCLGSTGWLSAQEKVDFEKILLSGDPAPGMQDGTIFNPIGIPGGLFINAPTIAEDGTVGFGGITSTSFPFQQALWLHTPIGFETLAVQGDPAPQTNSTFFSFPSIYFVEPPRGSIKIATFHASLADPFAEAHQGVWVRQADGTTRLVILGGDPVPGISGAHFRYANATRAANGVFVAQVEYTPSSGSTSREHEGFWKDSGSGLQLVIADNMPAPGTGAGVNFGTGTGLAFWGTIDEWSHNDLGRVAFNGYLKGAGINTLNDEGVWAEDASGLNLVAREGDPAPGVGPQAVMRLNSGFRTFGTVHHIGPQINNRGTVVFSSAVSGPGYDFGEGLWVHRSGDTELLALAFPPAEGTGSAAPGMSQKFFTDINVVEVNNQDTVAFQGYAHGNGQFEQGIWWTARGSLTLAIRSGQAVPWIPGATFNSLGIVDLTEEGELVIVASIEGAGIDPFVNDKVLFRIDPGGDFFPIVRRGQVIDVQGGGKDLRTIADWSNGKPNGKFLMPFVFEFTDGSSGVFRVWVSTAR